ncbi:hypothetical protein FRC17_004181 [Serendipita sp. 399]|nr:hypothetical protein FRC17_004181 [Serendipita sp. 399]
MHHQPFRPSPANDPPPNASAATHQSNNDLEDDTDDIVGSYLADSSSFLNAWSQSMNSSSHNEFQTSVNEAQAASNSSGSQAWTPPSWHATRNPSQLSTQQYPPQDPPFSRSAIPSSPLAMSSSSTQAHATLSNPAQTSGAASSSGRTVRKSTSNRKLKLQSSTSNLANAASNTNPSGGPPTSLPDPSLFPDPYPSGFNAGNASTTPPVSLFSAGSSSARSSAYTSASPASALRSSVASSDSAHNARHQRPSSQHHPHSNTRLSAGDGIMSIGGLPQSLGHSYLLDHSSSDQANSPALSMGQFGFLSAIDSSSPSQVGLASTTDEGVQLRDVDQQLHSAVTARPGFASAPGSRPMTEYNNLEKTRWSSSDAASRESKTSSWGNFNLDGPRQPSGSGRGADEPYDSWRHEPTEEREEEYHSDDDLAHEDDDMDRTTAVVLAEQGHGEIVHGEGRDVNELNVPNNTTHLLLGSCATPNHLPHFLVSTLPSISHSLLVLDVSACFLNTLPPPLAACRNLEELNVASNPLRVLPTWLAVLTNLRVLIADSIGTSTLPPSLSAAVQLHTLSIRNNRMYSLPCWLCLLPALETLYLDGNPFQGPWRALVDPLIARPVAVNPNTPSVKSPFYPPNTPHTANSLESTDPSEYSEERHDGNMVRQRGASVPWSRGHHSTSSKELNVAFLPPAQGGNNHANNNSSGVRTRALTLDRDKEDVRPSTAGGRPRMPGQDSQSPRPHTSFSTHDAFGSRSLSRTKTAPSRRPSGGNSIVSMLQSGEGTPPLVGRSSPAGAMMMMGGSSAPTGGPLHIARGMSAARSSEVLTLQTDSLQQQKDGMDEMLERGMSPNSMRKMRSTGDMRISPAMANIQQQQQSERVPDEMGNLSGQDVPPGFGKFMSVGARGPMKEEYKALTATMFEPPTSSSHLSQSTIKGKDKEGEKRKWGFLKKVSKGRLRSGSVTQGDESGGSAAGPQTYTIGPPRTMGGMGGPSASMPLVPHTSAGNVTAGAPASPFLTASQVGSRSTTSLNNQTSPQRRVLSKRPTDPAGHVSMFSSSSSNGPSTPSTMSMFSTRSGVHGPPLAALNTSARPATSAGLLAPPSATSATPRRAKRRSFLPLGGPTPISIPSHENNVLLVSGSPEPGDGALESPAYPMSPMSPLVESEEKQRERHQRALKSVMGYLRDMCDLSAGTSMGAAAVTAAAATAQAQVNSNPNFFQQSSHAESLPPSRGPSSRSVSRRPTLSGQDAARTLSDFNGSSSSTPSLPMGSSFTNHLHSMLSDVSSGKDGESVQTSDATADSSQQEEKKVKDDKNKRAMIVKEIVSTERTYVKLLTELVDIYVKPATAPVTGIASSKETVVPASERKIVFNGLESLWSFHKDSFCPSLEQAAKTLEASDDADGQASAQAAFKVAQVFVSHAAFLRMYSTYINNFDNAMRRTKQWTDKSVATAVVNSGAASTIGAAAANADANAQSTLTPSQKKRIKQYLKKCRTHPRHSQMNMEAYLLLPVQRIPRYRLLFEELVRATPTNPDTPDVLQKALDEITVLASNMNEGKREAESRRKLVQWQGRIRGKFPSPLVQPHRRLIMDGRLQLTRVVRKMVNYFEVMGAGGEKTLISVECLAPEVTPRSLTAILCNDLLVLCKDPSGGKDAMGPVDLWAVLRMQTVPQPAGIVHGSALRLVDNKAILYFDLPSTTEALTWSRAINMHIPASTK